MSFSYDPGWSTDKDWVRARVGDKEGEAYLLDDEEILALIAEHGGRRQAVLPCLDLMIAASAARVDWNSGQEGQRESQRPEQLRAFRATLVDAGFPEPVGNAGGSRVRRFGRREDALAGANGSWEAARSGAYVAE